jgi:quercetin dioxygenase-like cupin family protein
MIAKTCFILFFFLFEIFVSQEVSAPAPVAVENEPLHHVVLKNDSVMVIHLTLPAGERTLYHTHVHDRVAIELFGGSITQQKFGDPEGPSSLSKPGHLSLLTADSPFTHRVHNVGSTPFEVIDVEILQRPQIPSPATAAKIAGENPVAGENPSARVYNWVLAPGTTSPVHTHERPYLIVSATALNLKMTAPDGQSLAESLKPGDFHWVNTKVTHTLGNAGSSEGQILEVELK